MKTITTTLFALLLLIQAASADAVVKLRESAAVDGEHLCLGQIADITGDETLAERLGKVFLGKSPECGVVAEVTREQVEQRLAQLGFADGVRLQGAAKVLVRRAGAVELAQAQEQAPSAPAAASLSEAELTAVTTKAVEKYLVGALRLEGLEVSVTVRKTAGELPAGTAAAEVAAVSYGALPGRATVELRCADGAQLRAEVEATATAPLIVLQKDLRQGDALTTRDVKVERIAVAAGKEYLPLDGKLVAGKQAARYLRKGDALLLGDLEQPPAVIKGQVVSVLARVGAFTINDRATALDDARIGEVVMAEKVSNNKRTRLAVKITGAGCGELVQTGGQR